VTDLVGIDGSLAGPAAAVAFDDGLLTHLIDHGWHANGFAGEEKDGSVVLSPELVLVCPELREYALRQMPALDPDAFLPKRPADEAWQQLVQRLRDEGATDVDDRTVEAVQEPPAASHTDASPATTGQRPPPLALAIAAYSIQQSLHMAVYATQVIAAVSGLTLLLSHIHGH
jgi:hypothetical protein